jgi:hypothetical protein
MFFSAVNIYLKNHENNTCSSENFFLQTLFFRSLRPLLQPCVNEKQVRVCPVGAIPCPAPICLLFSRSRLCHYSVGGCLVAPLFL